MPPITNNEARKYIALRQLRVSPEKTYDYGEHVPEANEWPHAALVALLHTGQLGEGPICDHSEALVGVHARIDQLSTRFDELNGLLAAAQTERDAANDARDVAEAELAEAQASVEKPEKSEKIGKFDKKG